VLWSSDRTGYGVVRLTTPDGPVVVVGMVATLAGREEGSFVSCEGDWEDHPVHGRQFRATGLLDTSPHTEQGLRIWLASSGIQGIGKRMAARVVDTFGLDTLTILDRAPQRLREVPGFGAARIAAVAAAWDDGKAQRALTLLLRGLGLSQRQADRILERYGERAEHVVRTEPYRLADDIGGIGFRTADALAQKLGLPKDDPGRARAAVRYVLEQESEQSGHCWLSVEAVTRMLTALDVPAEQVPGAIEHAEGRGALVVEGERLWPSALWVAEDRAAHTLRELLTAPAPPIDEGQLEAAERWVGVTLDPSQREAVALALQHRTCIVTGGPGTGKTTLLRVLLRVLVERGEQVSLASPTGRAARRMEEATGLPASTIHRLLKVDPRTGGFVHGLATPLDTDAVVIDEASMVDVALLCAVTDALPVERSPRLILVGDVDQLPSVGPGQVLRDLVASGVIPVARLQQVHRQQEGSAILVAAAAIREGRVPPDGADTFLLPRPDAEDAVRTLLKVVGERLPARGFAADDIQVLTPTRRGVLGTERLNAELQRVANPGGEGIPELRRGEQTIRLGDRVICTKNRYDLEVFNGDTGRVTSVTAAGLTVDFDGRAVAFDREDLGNLDLAYALTVHKSQGSEYGAVVVALHGSAGLLLRRNLFYTAVTRARRFLCVVGSPDAWGRAVRQVGGDDRNTGLAERLRAGTAFTRP
jgi:exodeoxyribonuclease V alpha subunit